jgi:hypothetical protein
VQDSRDILSDCARGQSDVCAPMSLDIIANNHIDQKVIEIFSHQPYLFLEQSMQKLLVVLME